MTCIWNGCNRKMCVFIHITFTFVHVRVQSTVFLPSSSPSVRLQPHQNNNSNNFISYLFSYALFQFHIRVLSFDAALYTFHFYELAFYDYIIIIIANWLNCFACECKAHSQVFRSLANLWIFIIDFSQKCNSFYVNRSMAKRNLKEISDGFSK